MLGISISVLLLYFALRDVDAAEIGFELRSARPGWLLIAAIAATLPISLRAWRWGPLIEPVLPHSSFRARNAASFVGFMANNLLPARVGEFARAYALSRLEPVSVSASFASLVVERVFDGLTVVTFLLVAMTLPSFPTVAAGGLPDFSAMALTLLGAVAAVACMLVLMAIFPRPTVSLVERLSRYTLPRSLRRPLVDALTAFLDGLGVLRSPRLLLRVALASLVVWGVNGASFYFGFLAFDIQAPVSAAFFLQSLIALAVAIPSAPGFFGLFEGAARVGLVDLFGIEVNKAMGFAIGIHIAGFIPVTVIGLFYLWRLGMSWREVERSEEAVEEAVESRHEELRP